MNMTPDLSIVVLNWNTSELLNGALESIVQTAGDLSYEVVVIDNASTDGGLARLDPTFKNDPHFSFIQREKNIGWAAINIMLKRARGKYILTLDPDALLHPGALQALLAFMESHPRAGAATAKLLNQDGSLQKYYRRLMTPSICFFTTLIGRVIDKYFLGLRELKWYRYDDLDTTRVVELEQPTWPCLIWRPEAVGDYIADEEIPFYFVDMDMSRRVYDRGYKIYFVPQATATHLKSTSFGRANDAWRQQEYYRSIRVYLRKHYPFSLLFLAPILTLDRALRALARNITGTEPLR